MSAETMRSDAAGRVELADALLRRYSSAGSVSNWAKYYRKKYLWAFTIQTSQVLKRLIDISGAVMGLLLLSPVFVMVAICIKATDRGPVLFWQSRVGKWGREFPFPKFRSMVTNAEVMKEKLLACNDHGGTGVTFKMKRDPRVTWIGRVIRRASIDELPQLWCVLKGEMSLVGPRPPVPGEVALYTLADRRRLDVTPGLTCIWQVSGRGEIPFDQQVQLDVDYIESRSFWMDLKLLARTVPAVLLGKGAY